MDVPKRWWGLVLLMCIAVHGGCAFWTPAWGDRLDSSRPPMPPHEYRGAWVATVANIDWPSKPGLSAESQRAEIDRIVGTAASLHLNALFVQVRPACDAMYKSSLEPWSGYLSGEQGKPTSEEFDPLVAWIGAAHAQGIELHVWINPFRARQKGATGAMVANHIAVRRPDLVREYDGYLWLDPGEPEAVSHTLAVVDDIVARYDVDGVHFDDYFYPYPKKDVEFPDDVSYAKFVAAGGKLARDDWRRSNIDGFVRDLYARVKQAKPWVRVSASPFGIWRPGQPKGVQGFDAVAGLHADARLWLREGWVDVLIPQLYWKIGAPKQPYADLLAWWLAQNDRGRLVLAGNYVSRINDEATSWTSEEILNQVTRTREATGTVGNTRGEAAPAGGNVHFSMIALMQNRKGVADALREGPYAAEAVVPETSWTAVRRRPRSPEVQVESCDRDSKVCVCWMPRGSNSAPQPDVRAWVVLARHGMWWSTTVLGAGQMHAELAETAPAGELTAVAVAAQDRYGRLSEPRIVRIGFTGGGDVPDQVAAKLSAVTGGR